MQFMQIWEGGGCSGLGEEMENWEIFREKYSWEFGGMESQSLSWLQIVKKMCDDGGTGENCMKAQASLYRGKVRGLGGPHWALLGLEWVLVLIWAQRTNISVFSFLFSCTLISREIPFSKSHNHSSPAASSCRVALRVVGPFLVASPKASLRIPTYVARKWDVGFKISRVRYYGRKGAGSFVSDRRTGIPWTMGIYPRRDVLVAARIVI